MKKQLVEFIGTFLLVFTMGALLASITLIPGMAIVALYGLAIGFTDFAMSAAIGPTTGGVLIPL